MSRFFTIAILLFIITESSSIASESVASQLSKCSAITHDIERLSCYDNILGNSRSPKVSSEPQAPIAKKPMVVDSSNSLQTAAPLITESQVVKIEQPSKPAPPKESNFGMKKRSDSVDIIKSSIVGDFVGWKLKDKITLANGQVWKIAAGRKLYHKATNPEVTITKGVFDSYRIKIDGLNRSARVVRIK